MNNNQEHSIHGCSGEQSSSMPDLGLDAYERKMADHKASIELALEGAPETMILKDPVTWAECVKNNTDEYGKAVIDYTNTWARLMEVRMAKGERLEDIAEETSHQADYEGITGFMYGCAVNFLAHCWIYGEQLRLWHNLKTQIGHEGEQANATGGVLNPALINITDLQ